MGIVADQKALFLGRQIEGKKKEGPIYFHPFFLIRGGKKTLHTLLYLRQEHSSSAKEEKGRGSRSLNLSDAGEKMWKLLPPEGEGEGRAICSKKRGGLLTQPPQGKGRLFFGQKEKEERGRDVTERANQGRKKKKESSTASLTASQF